MMSCYCAGWKSRDSVPQLVENYLGKKVKVDEFVSHTFTLTDINQAFEVMHQGKRYVHVAMTYFFQFRLRFSAGKCDV